MKDIRQVGYIRTTCYTKTIGMFRPERVFRLQGIRQLYRRSKRETAAHGCVIFEVTTGERYIIDYDRKKKAEFPDKGVLRMLRERKLTDFIVGGVVMEFTSTKTVEALNAVLRYRYEQKRTPDVKRTYLKPSAKLYATFTDNSKETKLRFVDALNARARSEMHASIGVLDLTRLETERAIQYGEREMWPLDEDTDLLRAVLGSLDFAGWPETDRVIEDAGLKVTPKPAAIRQYRRERGDRWTFDTEVEL